MVAVVVVVVFVVVAVACHIHQNNGTHCLNQTKHKHRIAMWSHVPVLGVVGPAGLHQVRVRLGNTFGNIGSVFVDNVLRNLVHLGMSDCIVELFTSTYKTLKVQP